MMVWFLFLLRNTKSCNINIFHFERIFFTDFVATFFYSEIRLCIIFFFFENPAVALLNTLLGISLKNLLKCQKSHPAIRNQKSFYQYSLQGCNDFCFNNSNPRPCYFENNGPLCLRFYYMKIFQFINHSSFYNLKICPFPCYGNYFLFHVLCIP